MSFHLYFERDINCANLSYTTEEVTSKALQEIIWKKDSLLYKFEKIVQNILPNVPHSPTMKRMGTPIGVL
jgi:hypothetical protein